MSLFRRKPDLLKGATDTTLRVCARNSELSKENSKMSNQILRIIREWDSWDEKTDERSHMDAVIDEARSCLGVE